jgi:hypothetical protein
MDGYGRPIEDRAGTPFTLSTESEKLLNSPAAVAHCQITGSVLSRPSSGHESRESVLTLEEKKVNYSLMITASRLHQTYFPGVRRYDNT